MSVDESTRIRIDLARGHWQIGERDDAVVCVERAAAAAPLHEGLLALVESCLEDLESGGSEELALRLAALRAKILDAQDELSSAAMPAPLATPTVARLLAEQGHPEQALLIAADVLRRNPDDARALAVRASLERPAAPERMASGRNGRIVAELERWLGNLVRRKQGGAWA